MNLLHKFEKKNEKFARWLKKLACLVLKANIQSSRIVRVVVKWILVFLEISGSWP